MMKIYTVLYIIQIVALVLGLVCTIITTYRTKKAIDYMVHYNKSHGNNKNQVIREFKKIIKMLGGK
jgi:predicted histidine transporter YuiF (NhaC family)